jgi:hypothetical protein
MRLNLLGPHDRVVRHHRRHDKREMFVELGRGRTHPDDDEHDLGGQDHVGTCKQECHDERTVDLAARRQENCLVPQPDERKSDQQRYRYPDGERADVGVEGGFRAVPAREQRDQSGREQRRVEQDVNGCSNRAGRERNQPGPRGQANGLRSQPIQSRSHRWDVPIVERTETATESDHFEEQCVDHHLLEDDGLVPPGADLTEPAQSGCRPGDEKPDGDVQQDLHHIEEMQDKGCPEADLGPVPRHRTNLLGAGTFAPLVHLQTGQGRSGEPHCTITFLSRPAVYCRDRKRSDCL